MVTTLYGRAGLNPGHVTAPNGHPMGLGPYTAQRAHEFTRLAVASGAQNPEQNVHVGDRRARGVRGMSVSRRAFEAFYWKAGVLEPRWGGCWGVVYASQTCVKGRTSRRRAVRPLTQVSDA